MNIQKVSMLGTVLIGIILHLLIFFFACYQFIDIPFGMGEKLVETRRIARQISDSIILLGAPAVTLVIAALYTILHSMKSPLTIKSGALGSVISSFLAQFGMVVLFGCFPMTLSINYMHYRTPAEGELYRLLQVPFNSTVFEFATFIITIPLAAITGAIFSSIIIRKRKAY